MHFRSHGCWRYSLLRSDLLQKSQIRCFDLSGFGASYSSLLPDVISLPQFPFFIVFSAKCHITFIGTQHDLCAFPHDFSVGISCIALCTFPAPSEYWQISSFPSPRIWNIVLPFFCFSFIDHTAQVFEKINNPDCFWLFLPLADQYHTPVTALCHLLLQGLSLLDRSQWIPRQTAFIFCSDTVAHGNENLVLHGLNPHFPFKHFHWLCFCICSRDYDQVCTFSCTGTDAFRHNLTSASLFISIQ